MKAYGRWPVLKQTGPNKASSSDAAEYYHVACEHPCYLFDVIATNLTDSTVYLYVFDLAAVPLGGTLSTLPPIKIPAGSTGSISYPKGRKVMNGIVAALSEDADGWTYQSLASAGWFDVTYF